MVFEFACPDCDYAVQDNEKDPVVESAQQHVRDKHDRNTPKRDEVEPYVTGPG